jgi:hypothetical protein
LVATSQVRAPGGPFIIALGASPRRAGDLVTQFASMSGAPVSVVLINPAIGGASHNLSNKSVVSNLVNLAARQDCVAVIASPPHQSFQMPMTDGQQVCRNVHHPDGIMINGKAHDPAKKENAIFTNCLKIVTSATVHDARFVIEGPVSLAQASPYTQHGHKDHAALWDTTAWREFVATAGDHRVEFDMCFSNNDHSASAHTVSKRTTQLASDAKTYPYLILKFDQRWCKDKRAHHHVSNRDTKLLPYFNHELLGLLEGRVDRA